MKKILLGMLLLIFAVSCSQKPESTVSKFIDGIKRQKIEETYKKYALDNKSENDLKLEYNNKFQQLFFETLFKLYSSVFLYLTGFILIINSLLPKSYLLFIILNSKLAL